jgi:hypothetical protein
MQTSSLERAGRLRDGLRCWNPYLAVEGDPLMRKGFLGSITSLLAGAGLALAQSAPVPSTLPAAPAVAPASTPYTVMAPEAGPGPAGGCDQGAACGDDHGPGCGCLTPGCLDDCYCRDRNRFWVSGEYLIWTIEDGKLPALLANAAGGFIPVTTTTTTNTTNVVNVTPPGSSTPITTTFTTSTATPNTVFLPVLVQTSFNVPGGNSVSFHDQSGFRLAAGYWLDDCQSVGLELTGFWLTPKDVDFRNTTGNTNFSFATPFVNQTVFIPSGQTLVSPNITLVTNASANVVGTASTELWGFEVNARSTKCRVGPVSFQAFGGFRYIDLNEDLTSIESVSLTPPMLTSLVPMGAVSTTEAIPPTTFTLADSIRTTNHFYGAQVGGQFDWCCGCWFLNGWGKIGVGDMHQAVNLLGASKGFTGADGGLLVRAGDIGQHTRDRCAFIPEGNLNLGYQFNCHFRAFVGYSFLWLSTVARPGDQITTGATNLVININNTPQTVNAVNTAFRFHSNDMLIQGCNLGLEIAF